MHAVHQTHSLSVSEALTLCPREPGVLRVIHGRIWATIDLDRNSSVADAGDHFVVPGQDLRLRAGQRVVLEAWPEKGQGPVQWQWLSVTSGQRSAHARLCGFAVPQSLRYPFSSVVIG